MSVSDITYANGWLSTKAWSISPLAYANYINYAWYSYLDSARYIYVFNSRSIWPSVYLKSNIKIIDGNGNDKPYKLAL